MQVLKWCQATQEGAADDLAVTIDTFEYVDAARLHVITYALGKRYRTLVQVKIFFLNILVLHPTSVHHQHHLEICTFHFKDPAAVHP